MVNLNTLNKTLRLWISIATVW